MSQENLGQDCIDNESRLADEQFTGPIAINVVGLEHYLVHRKG